MRLIGMLDSPYVRLVAIALKRMDLPFTHEPLSVFRNFDEFAAINPVVKAPTLVTDDGTVLMDSTLILEYLDLLVPAERRLSPAGPGDHARAQRITGLALAACEKTVQIVYETNLRPVAKQHPPWIERVSGQLAAAYRLLEGSVKDGDRWLVAEHPLRPDITTAVAWRFTQSMTAGVIPAAEYPGLTEFSARSEALPEFRSTPID